jgi:hypothetical protein
MAAGVTTAVIRVSSTAVAMLYLCICSVTSLTAWENGRRCDDSCHKIVEHSGGHVVFVYLLLAVCSSKCQSDTDHPS